MQARSALTVLIDTGSTVGGDVLADRTAQVYVFDSTIGGGIGVLRATEVVNICGNTVKGLGIGVVRSSTDILVGDPLALGCAGNTVTRGGILLWDNFTEVELIARGNDVQRGSMYVLSNDGPSDKFIEGNTGGRTLRCHGNDRALPGCRQPGLEQLLGAVLGVSSRSCRLTRSNEKARTMCGPSHVCGKSFMRVSAPATAPRIS